MATTTNYGWTTPDNTGLVKDGASNIRTLGSSIDTTLGTALNAKANSGLVLIKRQTVGTAVSSVTVTGAFNSTYENYRVVIGGVDASSAVNFRFQFGSTANEHYGSMYFDAYDAAATGTDRSVNAANVIIGIAGTGDDTSCSFDVFSPNLAKRSTIAGNFNSFRFSGWYGGAVNTSTQYTAFNILVGGGATLTGGTISVYAYGMS
jgi:hypothetical protein